MLLKCCIQYAKNFGKQQWQQEWKRSVFILIPKKDNAQKFKLLYNCTHFTCQQDTQNPSSQVSAVCELISRYTSCIQKRQRNQRSNCQHLLDHRKSKGIKKKIQFCFIDYTKTFDCVNHNKLWKILKEMGMPDDLTSLLRSLYAGHEATVRTGHETTDWFQISKELC